ncbi:hypothetical protein L249_7890, partial [Ophiocordyceps polyrhachis-furcata BCC 54312]
DSTNTAFYKDMRYKRLLFDFYVEIRGSRFARGLANFVSIDALGGLTRDSALPLPSSNRDKDPILNPRESSSELSDLFLLSELSDFFINTPSNLLFNNSKGNKAAKKIAAKEQKSTTKKIVVSFKNPTLFCAEGRTLSKKAKTLVVTLKAIAL